MVPGRRGGDLTDEIERPDLRERPGAGDEVGVGDLLGRDDPPLEALGPEMPDQAPRVHPRDPDHVPLDEERAEARLGPPVVGPARRLADDEPLHVRPVGLPPLPADAVVADQRVGHRDDLSPVRWIREDLLVARHRGREHDLAAGPSRRTDRPAGQHQTVLQGYPGLHAPHPRAEIRIIIPISFINMQVRGARRRAGRPGGRSGPAGETLKKEPRRAPQRSGSNSASRAPSIPPGDR